MRSAALNSLEDELGDVLEKALRQAGLDEGEAAKRAGIPESRLRDAIDYRSDLRWDELGRLAQVLGLNEVGLCALGSGHYPRPEIDALPFTVEVLAMSHGIGVVNAYLVSENGSRSGILFDTGSGIAALGAVWPDAIIDLSAVFLTHVETEHAGALCAVMARFGAAAAFIPEGAEAPCGQPAPEGMHWQVGDLRVDVFSTPGHAAAHNSYLVRRSSALEERALLIAGDMIFAGSAGGAYFCQRRLKANLRRVLEAVPRCTVIAPGHGPMTTVDNELRFNPFLA
ncbi:MAG TPA: MBL fold metallo-hydrolase [Opitutaceae bacterium]|jgi:glyoxylase-like metal-dependent hydrolase (beta-lactamase superfamily II)